MTVFMPGGEAGNQMATEISTRRRSVSLLICIFGGLFGLHRFYVGRWVTGILMMLATLAHVGVVWWVIDLVWLSIGSFRDAQGRRIAEW